ncbi:dynein axonemal heavy chain 17 [Phyllostomus discolor]|uniref:Dynein axonemal heavy chain 17 n=1 Tax=Phyllostomus discolor TaxID=89673 RepID=A0A834DUJ9_9CHIR|nr:dynein axonemal heavy chain 17 [Phyllostomus discolor]
MIRLIPTVGIFITMNPGYAGRTELPENLKALFRPCAMVVPDFELICEIMLVAEGFLEARLLARKFITLYTLCKELLSKQDHYDWGLRAIKSVLVVAGSLKRGDPSRAEDQVLMRALRDFNIPKIVTDDLPVFMGLIGDLFPALDVPRKRDLNFEKVLKSLNKTYQNLKRKPVAVDLDPKAVTCDELFGIINPATREWKDGLFSTIMRDLANITHDGPKWIVLDGDIDPMWIESLNTVMDDNKVRGDPGCTTDPPEPQEPRHMDSVPLATCRTRRAEPAAGWGSGCRQPGAPHRELRTREGPLSWRCPPQTQCPMHPVLVTFWQQVGGGCRQGNTVVRDPRDPVWEG